MGSGKQLNFQCSCIIRFYKSMSDIPLNWHENVFISKQIKDKCNICGTILTIAIQIPINNRKPALSSVWDVFGCDIVSGDQIAHGKYDCRTVIFTMIFYRSLASESSVTGLGVHTRWWMYGNITLHSLCYLARVRPVGGGNDQY